MTSNKPKPAGAPSRRIAITDAAIEVLAAEGAHGLTHLAVDRAMGLAAGSTSYYFRRRLDLLMAAGRRVAELILADLSWVEEDPGAPPDTVAESLASTLMDWIAPRNRSRTLALMELSMTGRHEPDLRAVLDEVWIRVTERNRTLYRALGGADSLVALEPLRALWLGLMMRAALGGFSPGPNAGELKLLLHDLVLFIAERR